MKSMGLALLLLPIVAKSDDFSKTWTDVEHAIQTRYYAREQRKDEMNSLLAKYGPIAKAAKTRDEFAHVVNNMIRDFKDSHFAFLTDADQGYYLMDSLARQANAQEMPEFGAWFNSASDGYTVQMVLDGSEAAKAGLRKGDVITQIDGSPFTPVGSLQPKVGSSATIAFLRGRQSLSAKIQIEKKSALEMFLDATNASAHVIERNGRKIGYCHLWTMASERFKTALSNAVLNKLRDSDAFILDIRDGFGGRPEGYADPFFLPQVWIDWKTSPTNGFKELMGYQRPMVLLINGGSRSAKEVLSFEMKASHRATLVGQTTAGNVLGTFPQRINDWAYIEIPIVDVLADGQRLEGAGVSPDVPVGAEFDPDGHDLDLEAAIGRLDNVKKFVMPK